MLCAVCVSWLTLGVGTGSTLSAQTCGDQNLGNLSDPGIPASPTEPLDLPPDMFQYDETTHYIEQRIMHGRPVIVAFSKAIPVSETARRTYLEFAFHTWGVFWNELGGFRYPSFTIIFAAPGSGSASAGAGVRRDDILELGMGGTRTLAHYFWHMLYGWAPKAWILEPPANYYGTIRQQIDRTYEEAMSKFFVSYPGFVRTGRDRPIGDLSMNLLDYDHQLNAQKGAMVLYLLDRDLQATGHHLGEVMRLIFQRFDMVGQYPTKFPTTADMLSIVNEVTGHDFTDFFRAFIDGDTPLPLDPGDTFEWICHAILVNACKYSVSNTSAAVWTSGGVVQMDVAPSSETCQWTATSQVPWITVLSSETSTGSGSAKLLISPQVNAQDPGRTGAATIAGRSFIVRQAGTCAYKVTPTKMLAPPWLLPSEPGGLTRVGNVSVTAPEGCPWTATSNVPWLEIETGASGSGNGTVSFEVQDLTAGAGARTGTLTVAGQTVEVTQADTCVYALAHTSETVGASWSSNVRPSSLVIRTTLNTACPWVATSSTPWIKIYWGEGAGNGEVAWGVDDNPGPTPRTGTITVAGLTFTVTQLGQGAPTVPPAATLVSPTGTVGTNTPTYTWNAVGTAASYYLWVTDSTGATKVQQWYSAMEAGCAAGTGTCSATPGTALAQGVATWRIQTWNSLGHGPSSGGLDFTVPAVAAPVRRPGAVGLYRNGTWYLDRNGNGVWEGCALDACIGLGGDPADRPVVATW
jgi:hypothetical protein